MQFSPLVGQKRHKDKIKYLWYIDIAATPAMAPPKNPAPAPNAKEFLPPPNKPPDE